MSQISPPIRILLIGSIAFLAVWMLFLRPGGEEVVAPVETPVAEQPATAAGGEAAQTAPGQAVEAGNNAAAAADARAQELGDAATESGATGTASGTVPAQPAKPGKVDRKALAKSGLPLPVLRAIADRKVLVLFFHNPNAPDDIAVRRQLDKVIGHHRERLERRRVMVRKVPIENIARYGQITRGVDVQQSPTIVVVDRRLRAETLVGFVDHLTIDQAIRDARRAK